MNIWGFSEQSILGQLFKIHSFWALDSYFQWPPGHQLVHLYILQATEHHMLNLLPSLSNLVLFLSVTKIILYSSCPLSSQLQPTFKNSSPQYLPKLFFSPWGQWSTFEPPLAKTIASAFQVVSLLPKIVPTNSSSVPPEFSFQKLNLNMPLPYLKFKNSLFFASYGLQDKVQTP